MFTRCARDGAKPTRRTSACPRSFIFVLMAQDLITYVALEPNEHRSLPQIDLVPATVTVSPRNSFECSLVWNCGETDGNAGFRTEDIQVTETPYELEGQMTSRIFPSTSSFIVARGESHWTALTTPVILCDFVISYEFHFPLSGTMLAA